MHLSGQVGAWRLPDAPTRRNLSAQVSGAQSAPGEWGGAWPSLSLLALTAL